MDPTVKLILNFFTIFLAAILIAPTAAILASWNAIPGDTLYSTKRTLEKIALAVTAPNYQTNSSLQTHLIARRTDEATDSLFKNSSSQGLDELKLQAAKLRTQIAAAPTKEAKQEVSRQAITQLQQTKVKLQKAKTTLAHTPTTTPTQTTTQINTTVVQQTIIQYIPIPVPAAPSPTPHPTPPPAVDLIEDIDDTEETIDNIIDDISTGESLPPSPSPTPSIPSPTPTPPPPSFNQESTPNDHPDRSRNNHSQPSHDQQPEASPPSN